MTDNIIVDTATRIFGDLCEPQTVNAAEEGRWSEELWNALEESGLTLTWVPDNLGGAGAEMIDGFAVLRVAGRFAAPVPLAETLMAGWLLAQAGISAPPGPMTIAPVHEDGNITLEAHGKMRGRARHIPFAPTREAHRGGDEERRRPGRRAGCGRGAGDPRGHEPCRRAAGYRDLRRRRGNQLGPGPGWPRCDGALPGRRGDADAADGRGLETHSRPVGAMVARPRPVRSADREISGGAAQSRDPRGRGCRRRRS